LADNAFARALPPPNLPNATAAGFFWREQVLAKSAAGPETRRALPVRWALPPAREAAQEALRARTARLAVDLGPKRRYSNA